LYLSYKKEILMPPLSPLPNDEENQQKLAQDDNTPFSAPDDVAQTADDTSPQAETNIDSTELYQDGLDAAAGYTDPLKKQPNPAVDKARSEDEEGYDNDGSVATTHDEDPDIEDQARIAT
jgi:hypothetical protein